MNTTKILGVATSLAFILSFGVLYINNPLFIEVINNISATGYNIDGIPEQSRIIIFNYLIPGLLMALFGVSLSKEFKSQSPGKIGSFMFVVSGISWMSFSLNPIFSIGGTENVGLIYYLKSFLAWGAGVIAVILTSLDYKEVGIPKMMLWAGIIVVVFTVFEITYFWIIDYSGFISTVNWTIYFMWFVTNATRKNLHQTKYIRNPS